MKKALVVLASVFLIYITAAGNNGGYAWRQVLDAIRIVESGGEPNGGRGAVGDGGNALGPTRFGKCIGLTLE